MQIQVGSMKLNYIWTNIVEILAETMISSLAGFYSQTKLTLSVSQNNNAL